MSSRLLIAIPMCMVVLSGCGRDTPRDHADPADAPREVTAADQQEAERLLQEGIGHLENKAWADSESAFGQALEKWPENQTVLRNRAILRVLQIIDPASPWKPTGTNQDHADFAAAVDRAEEAIAAWRSQLDSSDETWLADLLLGKLKVHVAGASDIVFDEGLAALQGAAALQPRQADLRMAVAQAMAGRTSSAQSVELLQELIHTFELAPANLYVLRMLLEHQALSLRSTNTDTQSLARQTIRRTLQSAQAMIRPLNDSVRKHSQVDLTSTLAEALADENADPATLLTPAMYTVNTIKAEIPVQIDRRRVDRHLLEYVEHRFDDALAATSDDDAVANLPSSVLKQFTDTGSSVAGLSKLTDVKFMDVDLNGREDLIVIRDGVAEAWERDEGSGQWSLMMSSPATSEQWTSVCLADIDRDYDPMVAGLTRPFLLEDRDQDRHVVSDPAGKERWFDTDPDFVVWSKTAVQILRNDVNESGHRVLQPVQRIAITDVSDVVPADIDADGDLDFVVAAASGLHGLTNTNGTLFTTRLLSDQPVDQLMVSDVDRNVAVDVVGYSTTSGPGLMQNLFHGRFRWLPSTEVFGTNSGGTCCALGDFDGNMSWDVVCGSASGLVALLTQTTAPGVTSPLDSVQVYDSAVVDLVTADLDNDGHQDIAALTPAGLELWRGPGDGQFVPFDVDTADITGHTIRSTDFDDDGDLDLLIISESGALHLLQNEGGNENRWMKIVVRGKEDDDQFRSLRVNMHGVGTVIEVLADSTWQAHIVTQPTTHVGLGQADRVDAIRLLWPNGVPQNIVTDEHLRPSVAMLAPQILKGSCPYIYSWTGERFEFFSDCLWSAPIGLVQASGDLAPTREWEHLLIGPHQLVAQDGEYQLQITEELWEIAYFDQLELYAIDHPPDVQVFTNEKVGPPALAKHRLHTVRTPRTPKSIVDGRGNDLLPNLANRDGDYVQPFAARRLQGLTDEWTMEFDLGTLPEDGEVRLFLTGWIFPTDTSLNLQIEQNPDLHGPVPPCIEIPNGNGTWKTVVPFFGFPAGKTKTMVVDLTGVVGADQSRFRLRSSMELYFDQVFFTAAEQNEPTVSQPCPLVGADLRYRGFSQRNYSGSVFRDGHAPEGYDYDRVTTEPRWPPISGRFTRYGNVDDLVRYFDDQLTVLGPGDQLTVRFKVPQDPVSEGWTRSFVLRNVGWDKDADLNTVYGQSSEPYPFRSMTRYPFTDDDQIPNSPDYHEYFNRYQTREYSPREFWNAVRKHASIKASPSAAPVR